MIMDAFINLYITTHFGIRDDYRDKEVVVNTDLDLSQLSEQVVM